MGSITNRWLRVRVWLQAISYLSRFRLRLYKVRSGWLRLQHHKGIMITVTHHIPWLRLQCYDYCHVIFILHQLSKLSLLTLFYLYSWDLICKPLNTIALRHDFNVTQSECLLLQVTVVTRLWECLKLHIFVYPRCPALHLLCKFHKPRWISVRSWSSPWGSVCQIYHYYHYYFILKTFVTYWLESRFRNGDIWIKRKKMKKFDKIWKGSLRLQ